MRALAGCEKMPVGLMNKPNPAHEDPELQEAGIGAEAARFVERKRTREGTSARTKCNSANLRRLLPLAPGDEFHGW